MRLSKNNKLKGSYTPPGDKSISHRIIILGSQTVGQSSISNLLESEDTLSTVKVLKAHPTDSKFIIFSIFFSIVKLVNLSFLILDHTKKYLYESSLFFNYF